MAGYGTQGSKREGASGAEEHNPAASSSSSNPTSPPTGRLDGAEEEAHSARNERSHKSLVREFYERNIGLFFVFSAQTFGSVVRVISTITTRLLYHPSF